MARYQLAWKSDTKIATIQAYGDALPAGSQKLMDFYHEAEQDPLGSNIAHNHVLYQHVRDALYKTSAVDNTYHPGQNIFPHNITDMAAVTIVIDAAYVAVTGVTLNKNTVSKVVGTSETLVATIAPVSASNTGVTWTTSDATKVTVSSAGLITAVAVGSATITATTSDGAKTATCVVTVTAS